MKWLWHDKDGGPESHVWVWGLEIKSRFSVLLMKFEHGTREAFHGHAFNAVSWLLTGGLIEYVYKGMTRCLFPSWKPIRTYRNTVHRVYGLNRASWVLSFRGPWVDRWQEISGGRKYGLTHGRKEVV